MVLRVEALQERLAKLEEVVERLGELSAVGRDEFLHDYRHQWLAERGLELAAQAVLDIGNHILAGEFGESATEYEGIVRGLAARAVLLGGSHGAAPRPGRVPQHPGARVPRDRCREGLRSLAAEHARLHGLRGRDSRLARSPHGLKHTHPSRYRAPVPPDGQRRHSLVQVCAAFPARSLAALRRANGMFPAPVASP